MQSNLEEQGVPAYLANENIIAMDWLLSAAVGGVKLQVAAEDVELGKQLIAEFESKRRLRPDPANPTATVRFECENCHEQIAFPDFRRGGVETCPHCRGYVDVPD